MSDIYSIPVKTIKGETTTLDQYKGKAMLIVNTASKCGFTPQFEGLEALYETYKDKDFVVLGFPCNQFLKQDPGSDEEIKQFCSLNYSVTFPMFSRIDVNGENTHPLFTILKKSSKGLLGSEAVKWNFTKFLVDQNGKVIKRFAPTFEPDKIQPEIEKLLNS